MTIQVVRLADWSNASCQVRVSRPPPGRHWSCLSRVRCFMFFSNATPCLLAPLHGLRTSSKTSSYFHGFCAGLPLLDIQSSSWHGSHSYPSCTLCSANVQFCTHSLLGDSLALKTLIQLFGLRIAGSRSWPSIILFLPSP